MITIGSLFSGVGGLDLGLEHGLAAAGIHTRTLWQVEQNDYARAVLARHWPHAERYTDVRTITASSVAPVDLLCGGFPCQDISDAGNGAGLAGERSGLFFEMARIIRELRPRIVVLENVAAITTRGLGTVLGELAALGYDARWGGLRASEVGAPHRRERWFCVGWLADASSGGQPGSGRVIDAMRPATDRDGQADRANDGRGWQTQSRLGGDAHGIPGGLDGHRWPAPPGPQHPGEPPRTRPPRQAHDRERLKALGNAVVPQCGAVVGRWIGTELLGGVEA
jgi:DNA (cytosine-5)-methyltransferase 1